MSGGLVRALVLCASVVRPLVLCVPVARVTAAQPAAPPTAGASPSRAVAAFCSASVYADTVRIDDPGIVVRMHPLIARTRYADAAAREQWEVALRGLRADATTAFVAAGVPDSLRASFASQLDSVLAALPALPAAGRPTRAAYVNSLIRSSRFFPVRGADRVYRLFQNSGQDISIMAPLTPQAGQALCWSALSVDLVLLRLSQPLEREGIADLERRNMSWLNYRTHGYTLQPLELLLSPGSLREPLPRAWQPIIAHLSGGLEFRSSRLDSLGTQQAIVAELGVIRYWNNWNQYSGASIILSAASGSTIGYGVMTHFARSMRAGYVTRTLGGRRINSLMLSADLYGLLDRSKKTVDQAWAAARGKLVLSDLLPRSSP